MLNQVLKILKHYPLCDRCLGRLFAKYGIGLSNVQRGKVLKTALTMVIHQKILENDPSAIKTLKNLSENLGYPIDLLYEKFSGSKPMKKKCYICNNELESKIAELSIKAIEKVKQYETKNFIVGVIAGSELEKRELEIVNELSLDSWESIRREVKREVGKKIQMNTGLTPEFKTPQLVVLLDLDKVTVDVIPSPLYLKGRYVKLGRFISQMKWVMRNGNRKYPLSVEDAAEKLVSLLNGMEIKLHASGREDVDVRMLGKGRPLIIELRKPKIRKLDYQKISHEASINPWLILVFDKEVTPHEVTELKKSNPQKIYRIVIHSTKDLNDKHLKLVKSKLEGAIIRQLTPSRVLRRRKEILRQRRVYELNGKIISRNIMELILRCDGGLYVKELAHGDDGRTKPSIAEILKCDITVLFVDVLNVIE
jgi:tRNA pseudouridine synthase 10